jgi:hypothetical protein
MAGASQGVEGKCFCGERLFLRDQLLNEGSVAMDDLRENLQRIATVEDSMGLTGARFHTSRSGQVGVREAAASVAAVLEDDVKMLKRMDEIPELTEKD